MIDRAFIGRLRAPICAAPMFQVSGPELVIAASRAGALGAFPAPNCRSLDEFEAWLAQIAAAVGDAPWAVNLITHASNRQLSAQLAVMARYRPPLVITALGSPVPAIAAVHAYGGQVIADVINLGLARKAIAAGVDGLACISAGAGGHTGFLSPFAFISAVRAEFDGLLIIGGGISDGFGVAGAVAAGADLVYVGTRFIAAAESLAAPAYKQMVVESGLEDLVVTSAVTGTAASWLKASLATGGYDPEAPAPARDYGDAREAARRWRDIWAAGQGVGATRAVEPAAAIVDTLVREYGEAIDRLVARRG